jgi:hypothetical protein
MLIKIVPARELTAKTLRACDYLGVDRRTDLARRRQRMKQRANALAWAASQPCDEANCNPPDGLCGPCSARASQRK